MKSNVADIITIDGTSGSGKSTISKLLAERLNFNLLDSGKLYRAAGYINSQNNNLSNNVNELIELLSEISLKVNKDNHEFEIFYQNNKIDHLLYSEDVGKFASVVSQIPEVRKCMFELQHMCVKEPGLIANGRDMGSEVFTNASLKIYITATLEIRARRRFNELCERGDDVDYESIYQSLEKGMTVT